MRSRRLPPLAEVAIIAHVGKCRGKEQGLMNVRDLDDDPLRGHAADDHELNRLSPRLAIDSPFATMYSMLFQEKSFSTIDMHGQSPEGMTETHAPESTVTSNMIHVSGF